jgi:hypothetical protein
MELNEQTSELEKEIKTPERDDSDEHTEKSKPEVIEYDSEQFLETTIIKDISRGIEVELKSRIIPIDKLNALALGSFEWLQSQRTIKPIPDYLK